MRSPPRWRTTARAVVLTLAACGSDAAEPTPDGGQMTARIDGEAWAASITTAMRTEQGVITVSGSDRSQRTIAFAFFDDGTGTYRIETGAPTNALLTVADRQRYVGGSSEGTGAIAVTTLTAERVAGTFEFTAYLANAGATGTRVITAGEFDVEF